MKRLVFGRNKMILGVADGLGNYFDQDPLIFRAVFLVSAIFGGIGGIAYLILAILMHNNR